ncbi:MULTISPECIES: SPW repeat domain-containing protein [Streptomyces]|uniref:SPW repeat domain-containing protein n=1 Tax=Streptomyces TaxID=1883 RepID=UPI0029B49612|nr:SPW repeat protein [Streptomyces sp. AK02-04a]MDX3758500.1 SPW repeat protein [Streptomyces sp. AK02-04a]
MSDVAERTFPGIEQHPDILALRAGSERATTTVTAQIMEGLALLAGLYLAASAWIVGFHTTLPTLAVTNLITGLAYAFLMGGGFGSAYERTHAMCWAAAGIGVWTVIAPFVVSGASSSHPASVIVNNAVVGGLAVVFAAGTGLLALRVKRRS